MRSRLSLMVSLMLLAGLAPLMSPQASADSELSPQGEHLVGDFTWIRGLNGTNGNDHCTVPKDEEGPFLRVEFAINQ